jgi:hypothetical protein
MVGDKLCDSIEELVEMGEEDESGKCAFVLVVVAVPSVFELLGRC